MIRIVLVEWNDGTWRTFRQPQWMARVRESPEAATFPRLHFDIADDQYGTLLEEWAGSAGDREAALALLARHGAVEVVRQ